MGLNMQKVVVVTGGTKGIGQATCELFIQNKFKVFVLDIEQTESTNKNLSYIYCDIADIQSINQAVSKIINKENKIDVLVSNAGIHLSANIENTTEKDFDHVVDVNFKGCFFLLKAVLPHMRQQGKGSIIIIGSDQCVIGKPNSAVYGATKAAIGQMTKSTALDYAQDGIRINCVCVGTIDTPLYRKAIERYSKKTDILLSEIEKEEAIKQPLGRVGKAEEVAELIYFLGSEKASFITGSLYALDGGYTAQ